LSDLQICWSFGVNPMKYEGPMTAEEDLLNQDRSNDMMSVVLYRVSPNQSGERNSVFK